MTDYRRLASARDLRLGFPPMVSESTHLDQTPAPPELIARAEALVIEYVVAICDINEADFAPALKEFRKAEAYVDWCKCLAQKNLANRQARMQSSGTQCCRGETSGPRRPGLV